ncbi:MAG: DUF523 domain-containing protein [Helicobacteraceae bacterium]|jgi:uncharacterized protein YbbK (DUF523 family)|nr:DUF523 domain-containing protein [Helicobacteraceae bacterium]
MRKKKAIVSACLLGETVRYDGTTKINNEVIEALKEYEIIPFCPEDPVMGTPRERISVIKIDGHYKVMTDNSKIEVTTALKLQTQKMMDAHPDADIVVLKSKSPSCGLGTTPILTPSRDVLKIGNGVAAELFSQKFPGKVYDENSFFKGVDSKSSLE